MPVDACDDERVMPRSRPARIAIFVPSLRGGGAERVAVDLANRLAIAGLRVDLLLVNREGPYEAELRAEVNVIDFGKSRAALCMLPLVRYLRRSGPEALLTFLNHVNIIAIIAKTLSRVNTRLVVSERNSLVRFAQGGLNRVLRSLSAILYPMADGIIAVSDDMRMELIRELGLAPDKVVAIPNPVDTQRIRQLAQEAPLHAWLQDPTVPVILAVGRLCEQKNYLILLEAFRRVLETRSARLVVLGDGPLRSVLGQKAEALGIKERVDFVGFQSNPFGWMARARLLVSASRHEGFPNVLVQAMACGLPVVSTDCPTGPREILADGRWGRLVPVDDAGALAMAMVETLDDPTPRDFNERLVAYQPDRVLGQYMSALNLSIDDARARP